jgi:hypothetical protein
MNDPDAKYLIGAPKTDETTNPQDSKIIQPGDQPAKMQPRTEFQQKGIDKDGLFKHKSVTTVDEVAEEHVYVIYRSHALDAVLEVDLLGDQATQGSDGKLPPLIHLECPRCTSKDPNNRSILSITYGNKHFEIEDLPEKDWGFVTMPDGTPMLNSKKNGPAIIKRRLTIKETFTCVYCRRSYRITDNIMSDA